MDPRPAPYPYGYSGSPPDSRAPFRGGAHNPSENSWGLYHGRFDGVHPKETAQVVQFKEGEFCEENYIGKSGDCWRLDTPVKEIPS